jgi:hypothetical protein
MLLHYLLQILTNSKSVMVSRLLLILRSILHSKFLATVSEIQGQQKSRAPSKFILLTL